MGLCEDDPSCDKTYNAVMPLSRASTRGRYSRIVGVTYMAGNQSHPRLRSPLLDRITDVVESITNVLSLRIIYIKE